MQSFIQKYLIVSSTKATSIFLAFLLVILGSTYGYAQSNEAIIIDHTCTDINAIPLSAIQTAKANLHIAYDHTSHGSQLITGMNPLDTFMGGNGIYVWSESGDEGILDIDDYFSPVDDLGYETAWAPATRTYLDNPNNAEVNVIMWSWCNIYGHSIQAYLDNMELLISEYGVGGTKIIDGTRTVPVAFVFMTGHTNTGVPANEWTFNANKQIRQHCLNNNRILYDFYDIECYDPDGNYFGDGEPNTIDYGTYNGNNNLGDDCSYNLPGGSRGNWATEWQNTHTLNIDWYNCSAAHSLALNGNRKAYAAWHLFARLAGWQATPPLLEAPSDLTAAANLSTKEIVLNWTDNSAEIKKNNFIISRQIDGGPWEDNYASVSPTITTFTDTPLNDGTYTYRIAAHLDDDGTGNPFTSAYSNIAGATIDTPPLILAPSNLITTADSGNQEIVLNWEDNSETTNEDNFIISRQVNDGAWDNEYAIVLADTTTFTDSELTTGNYNYRVIAYLADNGTGNSFESQPSNESTASIITPTSPLTPTALNSSLNNGTLELSWIDNSDNEEFFTIERSTDTGGFIALANTAAGTTTFIDNTISILHTYTYRVRAGNDYGNSLYSNETSVYIPEQTDTITITNSTNMLDSFLIPTNPDTNYGTNGYTSFNNERFLVKFLLPEELTGKKIISATVHFFVWGQTNYQANQYINIYPVTRAWDEASVTYNSASTEQPWTTPGGDFDNSYPITPILHQTIFDHVYYPAANITDTVQQWVSGTLANNGLLLINDNSTTTIRFKAREYSTHSFLEITYADNCENMAIDLNGDNALDICLKNNTNNKLYLSIVEDGTEQFAVQNMSRDLTNIKYIKDVNNDGNDDFIAKTENETYIWLMDGVNILDEGTVEDLSISYLLDEERINNFIGGSTKYYLLIGDTETNNFAVCLENAANLFSVPLAINCSGATQMVISEDPDCTDCEWEPYTETKNFVLSPSNGVKTIYSKFKNNSNQEISGTPVNIIIDTTHPQATINTPENGSITTDDDITVEVSIDKDCWKVLLNDQEAFLDETNYMTSLNLHNGENNIEVIAIDVFGNISLPQTITITKE